MLIKYEFINGEITQVEVDEAIGEVILQIEHDTYNSNRRETRRHESLSDWNDKMDRFADLSTDIEEEVMHRIAAERLYDAINKLKPDEQDLIYRLYLDKPPITQAEYARLHGTTVGNIKNKAWRIREKLAKLLNK